MKIIIRILTIVIILLPLTEILLVSHATFIDYSNEWRQIEINKGNHSYYPAVEFFSHRNNIEFYFKTNETWYYPEPTRNGWNKLRGFSKGLHHDNGSARLVYKCVNDSILLVGSYCYVDGVHPNDADDQQAVLDTLQPNEIYHCIIKEEDGKFKFYFDDKYWETDAGKTKSWGYMLNPFIGGVFTLNHDWHIELVDVKRNQPESFQSFEPGF